MSQPNPLTRPLDTPGTTPGIPSVAAAAAAAAERLPTPEPLVVGEPVLDPSVAVQPDDAGTSVVAGLAGGASGEIAVVVAQEIVDALKDSPLGQLDIVAAVQPALEAAAAALGDSRVQAGREVPADLVQDSLDGKGTYIAIPLVDAAGRTRAAVLAAITLVQSAARPVGGVGRGLDLLRDVEMEVTAELGRTRMTVRDLLSLAPGAVVELDRAAGSPSDLYVNGTLIARGEVVVIDEDFGIRITEIVAGDGEGR